MTESPEVTGNFVCPSCPNREMFTGYDDHGYPGSDDGWHDDFCRAVEDEAKTCTCEITLRQDFRVEEGEIVSYSSFTPAAYDAEIGDYDRIECGVCGTQIYPTPNGEAHD